MNQTNIIQEQLESSLGRGDLVQVRALASALWMSNPGLAAAGRLLSISERLNGKLSKTTCRLAFLRSFTLEPAVAVLRAAAWVNAIEVKPWIGAFNAYPQEILDSKSPLYGFQPDIAVMAVQTRDIAPDLWWNFSGLSKEHRTAAANQVISTFRDLVAAFRSRTSAHLILHNLELPPLPSQGVLDGQDPDGQIAALQTINRSLQSLAIEYPGVCVLDYDSLVARHGRTRWHDERKWLTMRMPISAECLTYMANEWLRFIHPLTGAVCKALVVDLDNTLWGGIVGEDGPLAVRCGPEYPGAEFQALQRAMLDLFHRGVLLAICSKNNESDAMEALEKHPGLLLRPAHFACRRINWLDKCENIRNIARELNIGTDAIAFLDDNPVERDRVRAGMPEVTVIELPPDPWQYARVLRECPLFERLALSTEDRERGRLYTQQRQRSDLQKSCASLGDFYRALRQEVEIAPMSPETLPRASQLCQKTNQFNLTTIRYTEQQLADMAARPENRLVTVRVRDRFGDNGVVGLAVTRDIGDACEIDTFLLSCRVIGRSVETVLLAHLIEEAKRSGLRSVRGWFLPTKKNAPAQDFYGTNGFSQQARKENGGCLWSLDLAESRVICPDWIKAIDLRKQSPS
jgi:FkbH-like protein